MKVEIIDDRDILSPEIIRERPGARAFGVITRVDDTTIYCMYRFGETKHTYDGVLVGQLSEDNGDSWNEPVTVADLTDRTPKESVISGQVAAAPDGSMHASYTTVSNTSDARYLFSPDGKKQKRNFYVSHSYDRGGSWSEPVSLGGLPDSRRAFLGQSLVLPNGQLFMPLGSDNDAGIRVMGAIFSEDNGKTYSPVVDLFTDPENRLNFDDVNFAVLRDGRVVGFCWTHENDSEETVEVRLTESSDNGRSWTQPQPVGMLGQLTIPLVLDEQTLITACNFRQPPEGIRLWISRNQGQSFDQEDPVQMWDPRLGEISGKPVTPKSEARRNDGIWDALEKFTFGTPGLMALEDGRILLTYYATLDGITRIRACRFKLL